MSYFNDLGILKTKYLSVGIVTLRHVTSLVWIQVMEFVSVVLLELLQGMKTSFICQRKV